MNVKVCVDSVARARARPCLPLLNGGGGALVKQSGGAFLMFSSRPSSARPPHSLILRCSFDGLCGSCPRGGGGHRHARCPPKHGCTHGFHHRNYHRLSNGWGSHTGSIASGCSVAALAAAHALVHVFPSAAAAPGS